MSNYKPHKLNQIIEQEHSIMQELRASGLFDEEPLEMVGNKTADVAVSGNAESAEQTSFFDVKNQYKKIVVVQIRKVGQKRKEIKTIIEKF